MRIIKEPEIFRNNIILQLNKIINPNGENGDYDNDSINLEKGIYNYSLKEATNRKVVKKWDNPYFVQIYIDRFRSIMYNISSQNNIESSLLQQIKTKKLKPHIIAFMTHQEMNFEKWEPFIQAKIKRDKVKYETTIKASTDAFTCKKCGSKNCTYYQQQTRSCDEPISTFVSCIDCGKHWRC